MESKIRVEYDFDKKEPYIQVYLETAQVAQPDMRDGMLRHLFEEGNRKGLEITYPLEIGDNYNCPQIRVSKTAKLNWVGLNAKCLKDINDNFEVGKKYNLLMATGENDKVYVKGSGYTVRTNDEMEFDYLFQFVQAWEITR